MHIIIEKAFQKLNIGGKRSTNLSDKITKISFNLEA